MQFVSIYKKFECTKEVNEAGNVMAKINDKGTNYDL